MRYSPFHPTRGTAYGNLRKMSTNYSLGIGGDKTSQRADTARQNVLAKTEQGKSKKLIELNRRPDFWSTQSSTP